MGEYWQVCNLTRGEMYDTRGNYKTRGTMTYEMRGALLWLLGTDRWKETDDIRLLSDYGGERVINKETWEATEEHGPGTNQVQFCDLRDIHFAVVEGRPLLTPAMAHTLDSAVARTGGYRSDVVGFRAGKPAENRFEEEKPPTPKVSASALHMLNRYAKSLGLAPLGESETLDGFRARLGDAAQHADLQRWFDELCEKGPGGMFAASRYEPETDE